MFTSCRLAGEWVMGIDKQHVVVHIYVSLHIPHMKGSVHPQAQRHGIKLAEIRVKSSTTRTKKGC